MQALVNPDARLLHRKSHQGAASHVLGVVFPGYHRDETNDYIWGENYTEWWRVDATPTSALLDEQQDLPEKPLDHYDLSEAGALSRLASRAHSHGVDTLLFWEYWFDRSPTGVKRFLHRPLDVWNVPVDCSMRPRPFIPFLKMDRALLFPVWKRIEPY